MTRKSRSWQAKVATAVGVLTIGGYLMFGSWGSKPAPLDLGTHTVTAQAAGTLEARSGTIAPASFGGSPESSTYTPPTAAQIAAAEADMEKGERGMSARVANLPASDPRVPQNSVPPAANTATVPRTAINGANAPGPLADNTFTYFEANQLNPGGAGLGSSSVNEPSVAQNGKYVFQTWNWGAARSTNGGNSWSYINPYTMADFCCDQDVIYDKGRDRMFWLRQGLSGSFASPLGGVENRYLITVDTGAASLCSYDIRPSISGLPLFANSWFDYPRISLSNNYLYVGMNVFSNAGAYVSHFLIRFALTEMAGCAATPFNWWQFTTGWSPAAVENARNTMFLGDQIVTSTGLNDQFRVYWIFDDSATLNFVDRTIAPYTFTNRNGSCVVPGGANPCARPDQRVIGAVTQHNTPAPHGLGATGDRVDFYWNVKEGNGFTYPYVESAGFHGGTIVYQQRKFIWNGSFAFQYAAVGANDREEVGLSVLGFWPAASGTNPTNYIGLDDSYNGNPPGWEIYNAFNSTGAWTASSSGDYLRVRKHAPAGVAWVATGYSRNAASAQYLPSYLVFGRARDLNGFNRFDQQ